MACPVSERRALKLCKAICLNTESIQCESDVRRMSMIVVCAKLWWIILIARDIVEWAEKEEEEST